MKQRNTKYFLSRLALSLFIGLIGFSGSELYQGKLRNTPIQNLKNPVNQLLPEKEELVDKNEVLKKLLEMSKENPQLYRLYRDDLTFFQSQLEAGNFENYNPENKRVFPAHYHEPENDQELLAEQIELYETINFRAFKFEDELPKELQNEQITVKIGNKEILKLLVTDNKLKVIENLQTEKAHISVEIPESSYLKIIKEESTPLELFGKQEIKISKISPQNEELWQARYDLENQRISAYKQEKEVFSIFLPHE